MSAAPGVARAVRVLWRGARAVQAVRRSRDFVTGMARAAGQLNDEAKRRGMDPQTMSERDWAQLAVAADVSISGKRPSERDYLEGPTETREEHYV